MYSGYWIDYRSDREFVILLMMDIISSMLKNTNLPVSKGKKKKQTTTTRSNSKI